APFTLLPSGPLHITAGIPTSVGVVIQGGAGPYGVNLQGTQLEGISAPHPDPMFSSFTVLATDKAKPTVATIDVWDRSGRHQFIEVNVTAASAAGAAVDSGGAQKNIDSMLE